MGSNYGLESHGSICHNDRITRLVPTAGRTSFEACSTMSSFRFGLIGCGVIAETHARALAQLSSENVEMVSCADIVAARAASFGERFGVPAGSVRELLADPAIDAVSICAPSGLHAEIAVQALNAGKHVIVEKPMDVSAAACDAMLTAQAASGKQLAVISQHRFDPATLAVRASLSSGVLGEVIAADVRVPWYRTQEYYDSGDWRGTWRLDGGGCLMNQGVHTLDLMLWLCGPVKSVYAQARAAAHERIEVEDLISATLTFESGAIGSLLASTAAYPGFPARLAIYGKDGSAVIEGDALASMSSRRGDTVVGDAPIDHALQVASGGTRAALQGAAAGPALAWGDAHREQFRDFVKCCREGGRPVVDGPEGRRAVATIAAIYESARTGAVVTVDTGR